MKTITKLSREELKKITGGRVHYSCICSNGITINGYASNLEDAVASVASICTKGNPDAGGSAECFDHDAI